MADFTIENFKVAIQKGDTSEATKILESFFTSDITSLERGQLYVTLASMEMEAQNSLNRQKLELIESLTSNLKSLNTETNKAEDEIDLELVRNQINDSK